MSTLVPCRCGCGEQVSNRDSRGRPRSFARGHRIVEERPCRECGAEGYERYNGIGWICKPCHNHRTKVNILKKYGTWRNYTLQTRYGISEDEWMAMLLDQDGTCALCRCRPATDLDHEHGTGRVRGALCTHCNAALGVLGDTVEALERAELYLTGGWDAVKE